MDRMSISKAPKTAQSNSSQGHTQHFKSSPGGPEGYRYIHAQSSLRILREYTGLDFKVS